MKDGRYIYNKGDTYRSSKLVGNTTLITLYIVDKSTQVVNYSAKLYLKLLFMVLTRFKVLQSHVYI